ncbi:hypothetical protein [Longimicrobium sp.]|uniref:hypothetical protein n=1 Tax=Longimicrobium sp. TaxID=2029185 RepID=UPI002E31D8B3|nr:hypothetical protein [Longimicrobium sp.]HEX6042014.1 hypothetical protein [Longimicrobium sp.]
MPGTIARFLRIGMAAVRLGALYGAGVFLLLLLLGTWTGEWAGAAGVIISSYAAQAGTLAVVAMLFLAAARHFGYVALWLLLVGAWFAGPMARWTNLGVMAGFIFWSVAAIPLYLVGMPGVAGPRPHRRPRLTGPAIVLGCWALLMALALATTPPEHLFIASAITGSFGAPPELLLRFARVIWGPAPLLIFSETFERWRRTMISIRPPAGA